MIQQAKLIWPKKRTTDNYMPIRCDWQAITQLPHITCDPYRPDIITVEANFWGRLAVAVHGSSMTYYFSPTSPQEFGQVVAHYISQWTGKPIEEAHAPRLKEAT
jgi:hypothetical protein